MSQHKTEEKQKFKIEINWSTILTMLVLGVIMFLGSTVMQSFQSKKTENDIRMLQEFKNQQEILNATNALILSEIKDVAKEIKADVKELKERK